MPRDRLEIGTHGKITVHQNANGTWTARTYYRDKTGKRRDLTASADTKKRAENKVKYKISTYRPATGTISYRSSFNQLAKYWEKNYGGDPLQLEVYKRLHKRKISPAIGELILHEITAPYLQELIEEWGTKDGKSGGLASAAQALTYIRLVLDEGVRLGAIDANPARMVRKPAREPKEVQALTPEQIKPLFTGIEAYYESEPKAWRAKYYMLPLVRVLLGTGMRPGEALGLRWCDIDLDTGRISVEHTQYRDLSLRPTKTKHKRIVYAPAWLVQYLRDLAKDRGSSGDTRVISAVNGEPARYSGAAYSFKQAAKSAGFGWVTLHTFRKTVATYLDRAVGVEQAALQLGHEGSRVTRDSYIARRGEADFAGLLEGLAPGV